METGQRGNINLRQTLPVTFSHKRSHKLRLNRFEAAQVLHRQALGQKQGWRYLTGVKGGARFGLAGPPPFHFNC